MVGFNRRLTSRGLEGTHRLIQRLSAMSTSNQRNTSACFHGLPRSQESMGTLPQYKEGAELPPTYHSWKHISRGLMTQPPGPTMDEDLRWDTTATFSINTNTPWDILRANLLWSIWCQRVAHAFKDDIFYLGVVLWHAWRNTI